MTDSYCPLIFRACDINFFRNVSYFRSQGWGADMAILLAQDEEARLLDQIEREEEAEANSNYEYPLD